MVTITTCPDCNYPTYIVGKPCPQCSRSVITYKKPKECRYCEHYQRQNNLTGRCKLNPVESIYSKGPKWEGISLAVMMFNDYCGQHKFKQTDGPKYFGV